MKIAPTWFVNLVRDVSTTFQQLRHKPVEGKPLISRSSTAKAYDSESLLKRKTTTVNDVQSMVNRTANQRALADLKASMVAQVQKDNPQGISKAELHMAVDLALHKAGLGKISSSGLVSRRVMNARITQAQLEQAAKELEAIQKQPLAKLKEALEQEPLPASFAVSLIEVQASRHSGAKNSAYKGDVVLGDLHAADVLPWTKPTMDYDDYTGLMSKVKTARANRFMKPSEQNFYLDEMVRNRSTDEQLCAQQFKATRDSALSDKRALLPEMKALFEKMAIPEEWHATYEVLALGIDEQR